MLLKLVLVVAVFASVAVAVAWWRRPSRRLRRLDLSELGVSGPAIVQFSAEYCSPCKAAAPKLRTAAQEAHVPFAQIDVGRHPDVARRYGVRSVPTIAVTGSGGRVLAVWTTLPEDGDIGEAARRAAAGTRVQRRTAASP